MLLKATSPTDKAIKHSSINMYLKYLHGLKTTELKEEDMPMV
jgi:hypothetical protein